MSGDEIMEFNFKLFQSTAKINEINAPAEELRK